MSSKYASQNELEEFTGRFLQRSYRSDDDSFCVCQYTKEGEPDTVFTLKGANLPEVTFPVTFRGRSDHSGHFGGNQFRVERILNHLPTTKEDAAEYIASLRLGIGMARANAMINLVGYDRFWIELERDAMQFTAIKGISRAIIENLQHHTAALVAQDSLSRFFAGDLPMSGSQYSTIKSFFHYDLEAMVARIKENPFLLIQCGYSFSELDHFCSRHTLLPVNDSRRLLAASQQVLINAQSRSHVALPPDVLIPEVRNLLNANGSVSEADIVSFLNSASSVQAIIYDHGLFYLPRAYKEEQTIASVLTRMAAKPPEKYSRNKFEQVMEKYAEKKGFSLSQDQQESVWTALTRSVCVITGGPGTGKSTILDAILYCWEAFHGTDWLLMAPTGKAAVRMTETTSQPAWTVHASLGLGVASESLEEIDEVEAEISNSLIVIDECSMLDQTVMCSLVTALAAEEAQTQHLIIVGDPDQLPSVGWGNVLDDIITSHEIPVRRLKTVYRQGAGNPIITNSGKMLKGDTALEWSNIFRRYHISERDSDNMDAACKLYCANVRKHGIENVVLLSPYRGKRYVGIIDLNKALQDMVNPIRSDTTTIRVSKALTLRNGDRVMQLKNTEEVSNGEVGTIQWINPHASGTNPVLAVSFESGATVEYSRDALHQLTLAYAMSIHKSQGSQWKVVIIILPNAVSPFLGRNLLYTAITRSSYAIAIVAPSQTISYCISNDKQDVRYTMLSARLREVASPISGILHSSD